MLGAFNQETPYYNLIEKVGIVDHSASLKLYQLLMRLACREWDFRGTINLYIPCLKLFEPIKHLFDERRISYIPLGLEFEEVEDGRKNTTKPDREWYLVEDKSKMARYGFPPRNKNGYIVWFEKFGYKSDVIEVPYKDPARQKKMRKYTVVYKSESGLEEAKKYLGN